jgi:hypothetical protein
MRVRDHPCRMKKQQCLASLDAQSDHWAEYLNSYTKLVAGQGYAVTSVKSQVYLIKRFLVCFRSHQEIPLDEAAIQRFLRAPHNANLTARAGTAALYRFVEVLREQGVVQPKKEEPLSARQRLIKNYERYLLEERGLVPATAVNNVGFANQFLSVLSKSAGFLCRVRCRRGCIAGIYSTFVICQSSSSTFQIKQGEIVDPEIEKLVGVAAASRAGRPRAVRYHRGHVD